jgi:hypothetical protein
VASLALRGALAGARLRTRFADDHQWDRFRWLRLRVAVSNLERLRAATEDRHVYYADALSGPGWLAERQAAFCHEAASAAPAKPCTVDWYQPEDEGFWPAADGLFREFARAHAPRNGHNVLLDDVPTPEPVLRQVPQD